MGEKWSCSLVKKILHLFLHLFGKVSVPAGLSHSTQCVVVQKRGSFAQQQEPLSAIYTV